jgi:hypothetical protein
VPNPQDTINLEMCGAPRVASGLGASAMLLGVQTIDKRVDFVLCDVATGDLGIGVAVLPSTSNVAALPSTGGVVVGRILNTSALVRVLRQIHEGSCSVTKRGLCLAESLEAASLVPEDVHLPERVAVALEERTEAHPVQAEVVRAALLPVSGGCLLASEQPSPKDQKGVPAHRLVST